MKTSLLVASLALLCAGCFSSVKETTCASDAECLNGQSCVLNKCVANDAGAGGGSAAVGGGSAAVGGGASSLGGGSAAVGGGSATGGGAAGTGGGTATCGCMNIAGCSPGDSPIACGSDGGQCALCGQGQQCVAGGCVTAACGPSTCNGCCAMGFCVTSGMQQRFTCGSNGAMCAQCAMNETCTNGVCGAPPACGPTNCANGCCDAMGQCRMGTSQFNCGGNGMTCATCMNGNQCVSKSCTPFVNDAGIFPDGGAPRSIGSPCMNSQDCASGEFCIAEQTVVGASGFTGGYCTAQCGGGMGGGGMCPAGAACVSNNVFGQTQRVCLATCAGPSDCRTGYVCASTADAGTTSVCKPNCANGGLAACPMGQTCAASGLCQ